MTWHPKMAGKRHDAKTLNVYFIKVSLILCTLLKVFQYDKSNTDHSTGQSWVYSHYRATGILGTINTLLPSKVVTN